MAFVVRLRQLPARSINHPLQTLKVSAYGELGVSIHLGFGQRLDWSPT